jgi:hypothetical protein
VLAEDMTGEFDEAESAEILAANWKDRRNEIARLQKSRNFKQVTKVQQQFRDDLSKRRNALGAGDATELVIGPGNAHSQKGKERGLRQLHQTDLPQQVVPPW